MEDGSIRKATPGRAVTFTRGAAGFVVFLLFAVARSAAIALVGGLAWLSTGAWIFLGCAAAIVALRPWRVAAPGATGGRWPVRIARFAGAVAIAGFFAATRPEPSEAATLLLALAACTLDVWSRGLRREILGERFRSGPGDTVRWAAAFLAMSWCIDGAALVVLLGLMLARHTPVLSRLTHGPVRWRELLAAGVLLAVVASVFRGSFAAEPTPCRRTAPDLPGDQRTPLRIATLGDSSTYGIFLPDRLGYPGLLERNLRAADPERRYEVWNCAFSGATSAQAQGQLERALALTPPPAAVTIYVGDNDTLKPGHPPVEEVALSYRENLSVILDACRARGVRPILITSPNGRVFGGAMMGFLTRATRELSAERGVELVDASAAILDHWFDARFFIWDFVHPNQLGHREIARMLTETLRNAELAPPAPPAPSPSPRP